MLLLAEIVVLLFFVMSATIALASIVDWLTGWDAYTKFIGEPVSGPAGPIIVTLITGYIVCRFIVPHLGL